LKRASIAIHLVIVAYVAIGWTITSRSFLFVYLLVLPSILLQWILNFGSSIVVNFENLARIGCWDDDSNAFQGTFFQTLLHEAGLALPNIVINTIACILIFVFWVQAMWRMILIVPVPP
jgi:hypothetical protein